MATWETHCATWSGGAAYVRLNLNLSSTGSSGWNVSWSVQSRDTHTWVTGVWDWSRSGTIGSGSGSVSAATGTRTISSGTKYVACDANGNGSCSGNAWMDVYYGTGTASGTLSLPRIAKAPSGLTQTVTELKPKSAKLSLDISSRGHGTSATHELQYRVQGSGTWIGTADQSITNLAANTFTLSGLKPNTTYQYRQRAWNNNGDTAYSSTYTFKTKPLVGMTQILAGLATK